MEVRPIADTIREVLAAYGTDVLSDRRRFNALLMDMLPDRPRERKLISSVISEGIGDALLDAASKSAAEQELAARKCVYQLTNDSWFSEEASAFAVECLCDALDIEYGERSASRAGDSSDRGSGGGAAGERVLAKGLLQDGEDPALLLSGYTAIGYKAFAGNTALRDLTVPANITRIYSKAFLNCAGLKSIELHGGIDPIGNEAFSGCRSLREIRVRDAKRYFVTDGKLIDRNERTLMRVFRTSQSGSVDVSAGIARIAPRAFDGSPVRSVRLPAGLKSIARGAFTMCGALSSVEIEGSPLFLSVQGVLYSSGGKRLLLYPSGRKESSYIVEDGTEAIDPFAFEYAASLASVTIPSTVRVIGSGAFRCCGALGRIILPDSVVRLGERVFQDCASLSVAMISHSVIEIGDFAFSGCSRLERVSIPRSVTTLGNACFSGCEALASVVVQDNVRQIGLNAFDGCSARLRVRIRNNPYMEAYCRAHRIDFERI